MLTNTTATQHFLPRIDQKLNAVDPNIRSENFRIFSFRVTDREKYQLELEQKRGRKISNNLAMFDLFSFDVLRDRRLRENFEALFRRYETNVEIHTRALLTKLAQGGNPDIKQEIIELFVEKLLNFVRNPYCVPKVIDTFRTIVDYFPTDPDLLAAYKRIVTGRKPHQAYLCSQLGITEEMYARWLSILFMLLFEAPGSQFNIFEGLIKSLMENLNSELQIVIHQNDTKFCLLSDRGFSEPFREGNHMALSFNLCSTAFVDYCFMDIETLMHGKFPPDVIERVKQRPRVKQVNVAVVKGNLDQLARYNRRVIEQCYERVYCASRDVWLG
jgi:hypothetical protein